MNLENCNSGTGLILVGINDLLSDNNKPQIDSFIQNVGTINEKCRFYAVKPIFIFGLVYTTRLKLLILEETYKRLEVFCRRNIGFILVDNKSISGRHLYWDG